MKAADFYPLAFILYPLGYAAAAMSRALAWTSSMVPTI
jgi:hypothetical protein